MKNSQAPLLSVVIPTYKRPQFLPRAIDSALQAAPDSDVQVLVIPNGPDESWKAIAGQYKNEKRVQWHSITTAHANAARNIGMQQATGKYIRFLDDDDLLIPAGAIRQIALLEKTSADICSSPIYTTDNAGVIQSTLYQPDTPDFIAGLMSNKRMHQMTAHVFLREKVKNNLWNEHLDFSQDNEWTFRLAQMSEMNWVKSEEPCGKWQLHTQNRISTTAPLHRRKKIIADQIVTLTKSLDSKNKLTESRKRYAAAGLWDCVHHAFFASPIYWKNIARYALELDPSSKPDLPMHNKNLMLFGISPLMLEAIVAPKRMIQYSIRRSMLRLGLLKQW